MLIHVIYLPIFFKVASLALGQSHDCPSASVATLKEMAKTDDENSNIWTLCIILGMYYLSAWIQQWPFLLTLINFNHSMNK